MDDRIEALRQYVAGFDRTGKAAADFWAGFDALAGDLAEHAWADDADPDLREGYTDLLAAADDAGWAVPHDQIQQ